MKKIAKIIGKSVLTIILMLGFIASGGQNIVTIQPDQTSLTPGEVVVVPITVTATFESAEFYIAYDRDVLMPASPFTTSVDSRFQNPTVNSNWKPSLNPSGIAYISLYSVDGVDLTMTAEPLLSARFIYCGGSSSLHFRTALDPPTVPPSVSKLYDEFGTYLTPVTWIDATMSGSGFLTVKSAAAGGLWKNATTWRLADGVTAVPAGFQPTGNVNTIITGTVVTADAIARAKDLTINAAGQLTLNTGISLTPTGTFTIESGGSFIDNNTSTTLNAGVKRDLPGNWIPGNTLYQSHLISSPVANQSNSIFFGSLMNQWNEATQYWDPLTMPYITMGVGTGYALSPLNPGYTSTFSGVVNTGNKVVNVTKTGATPSSGYNLVGNPYPSPINWNSSVTLTNVGPTAWVWNNAGNYIASNQGGGTVIAAMQGFFVQATAAGSVTFTNAARTHSAATFYKSTVDNLLTLKVEGNNYWDRIQVSVNPLATAGFDADYDARKLAGSSDAPQIYSVIPGEQLSINTLPDLSGSPVIQLDFKAGTQGSFILTASDVESFPSATEFYLEDLIANKVQNLKANSIYNFTATPGQPEHRFNLHFSPVGMDDNKTSSGIKIYSSEKTVYVNVTKELSGSIIIYNLLGTEIISKPIQSLAINKINLDVPSGFYLVKVDGNNATSAQKVFIR